MDQPTISVPDIRVGGTDTDIWLGSSLICFPVSHVYFFDGGRYSPWIPQCEFSSVAATQGAHHGLRLI